MTPVLCLNCGKARGEHTGLGKYSCEPQQMWTPPLDESAIEQRVVDSITTWLVLPETLRTYDTPELLADAIRSGAWKVKP